MRAAVYGSRYLKFYGHPPVPNLNPYRDQEAEVGAVDRYHLTNSIDPVAYS